jgi:hypothetical protein
VFEINFYSLYSQKKCGQQKIPPNQRLEKTTIKATDKKEKNKNKKRPKKNAGDRNPTQLKLEEATIKATIKKKD